MMVRNDTHCIARLASGHSFDGEALRTSKYHIIVFMLSKHIHRFGAIFLLAVLTILCFLLSLLQKFRILLLLVSLLLVGHLLEPVKLLSVKLVQLGVDVCE